MPAAGVHERAVANEVCGVADLIQVVQEVGRHEDAAALFRVRADALVRELTVRGVERVHGLVQQQDRRLRRECDRDRGLLAHALRERGDALAPKAAGRRVSERVALRHAAPQAAHELDGLVGRQVVVQHGAVAGQQEDGPAPRGLAARTDGSVARRCHGHGIDGRCARALRDARERGEERRLAIAVWRDEAHDAAARK